MQVHKMKAIWEISIPVRRLTTWKRKWLKWKFASKYSPCVLELSIQGKKLFELRASCFLGRCSTTRATSQPLLCWLFWSLAFCLGWPGLKSSYFTLPAVTGMRST
jgi:hypothetical protein